MHNTDTEIISVGGLSHSRQIDVKILQVVRMETSSETCQKISEIFPNFIHQTLHDIGLTS